MTDTPAGTGGGVVRPSTWTSALPDPAEAGAAHRDDDAEGDGEVATSFAELAAAAGYPGGDHAPDVTEMTEPTLQPLLLHSLTELREIWLPLVEAAGARSVAEIGSESGSTTKLVVDLLRRGGGGRLLVVDPDPGVSPVSGGGLDVEVVRGYSPEALDGHAPTDAYLIDGDHNYATVSGELRAIDTAVQQFGRSYFPLVILHDVGWPAGRRDQYYAPDRIPATERQPYSWDVGVEIDSPDGIPGRGFRGNGAFAWALTEGGPGNGVRTAIEDFVADQPELRFFTAAPVFGLGVVIDRRAPWAARAAELLAPWVSNVLLARLERNRVDLYLRVLQMQDDAGAVARDRQRDWARLDAERSHLAAVELEWLGRIAELERRAEAERLRAEEAVRAAAAEPRLVAAARAADAAVKARLAGTRLGASRWGSAAQGSAAAPAPPGSESTGRELTAGRDAANHGGNARPAARTALPPALRRLPAALLDRRDRHRR
jgi:Methyltransferase domain